MSGRMDLQGFVITTPASLDEALALLEPGNCQPFAGGTDLMVMMAAGRMTKGRFVSLDRLSCLRGIEVTKDWVALGGLTTYTEIQEHPVMQAEFPMLVQAARETGGLAIQNRGTLAGNIANASPAADSPPALLCYDAEIELLCRASTRRIAYAGFHTGYKRTVMEQGELIGRIFLPRLQKTAARRVHFYRKVGPRKAQAISKVCVAASMTFQDGAKAVRLALGGVAPTVVRARSTEALLEAQVDPRAAVALARAALAKEIAPIDDVRSTARYRLHVAQNLLQAFIEDLT